MYISEAVRNGLCNAGAIVLAMFLIFAALVFFIPHIIRETRYIRCRARIRMRYYRKIARIKRDYRRYKAAMRAFDKPIRWREM